MRGVGSSVAVRVVHPGGCTAARGSRRESGCAGGSVALGAAFRLHAVRVKEAQQQHGQPKQAQQTHR